MWDKKGIWVDKGGIELLNTLSSQGGIIQRVNQMDHQLKR